MSFVVVAHASSCCGERLSMVFLPRRRIHLPTPSAHLFTSHKKKYEHWLRTKTQKWRFFPDFHAGNIWCDYRKYGKPWVPKKRILTASTKLYIIHIIHCPCTSWILCKIKSQNHNSSPYSFQTELHRGLHPARFTHVNHSACVGWLWSMVYGLHIKSSNLELNINPPKKT